VGPACRTVATDGLLEDVVDGDVNLALVEGFLRSVVNSGAGEGVLDGAAVGGGIVYVVAVVPLAGLDT